MQMSIEQAIEYMDQLFGRRDFAVLESLAQEITQEKSEIAAAWRYLGAINVLARRNGGQYLHQASLLGDVDSDIWLSVSSEIENYREQIFRPDDIIRQVELARLRHSRYMDFPMEVHIETLAICNAACTFCPYPTMERKGDRMSEALIDKILDDLREIPRDLPFHISPFKVNDPFLDKRIFSVCEKINYQLPNATLRLFTNGSPLTETVIDRIADIRNVAHLWVSLNEYEKDAYEKTMNLPYEKTIKRLDALHRRVEVGYPHPVVVSRVCEKPAEDRKFEAFLKKNYPLFGCFLIQRSDWAGQVDTGALPIVPPSGCGRWYELSIMASGKVALCCMDGEGKHVIGDLSTESALEVYNAPDYKKMRQFMFSRFAAAAPCDTCIYT